MAKNLVIVESPAKAKTIGKYLGSDYSVKSSFGHVRDLPKKGLNIDIKHSFEPTYEVSPEKQKVVNELKKATKSSGEVWLATDEDREGEAIAWHLTEALKLPKGKAKRIVFHEITKPAVEYALKHPRQIDEHLVDAQQARRVLDRLVGYELSPVLWKKVKPGLSAGRVQSVAVRLVVEREREITAFKSKTSYKVIAIFRAGNKELSAELGDKLADKKAAETFLKDCTKASFSVADVSQKPASRSPSPPFTTSTLQQEAARKLGFSVKQTMTLAQRLYEDGFITYMRTDSVGLAELAIAAAQKYVTKQYGQKYHHSRQYETKTKRAQEAHEAIRPTDFNQLAAGGDDATRKLYKLIWQRALASQMSAAELKRGEIDIAVSNRPERLVAKGEILTFDGFIRVYGGGKDDVILPEVKKGQKLVLEQMTATETFDKQPARYSEASLVRKLEELGIGRPSTYAPTISTIQSRGYIEKNDVAGEERQITILKLDKAKLSEKTENLVYGADRNKLLPTYLAEITTDFLVKHFGSIVDYDFTAKAEDDLDEIAAGEQAWVEMIKRFYEHFQPLVKMGEQVSRKEATRARLLGKDPASDRPIMARFGRFGPMLQRGEAEAETKPDFAPLPEGESIDSITLEKALPMFNLPRVVGKTDEGKEITANIGRFGPYIQIDKIFVSIKPHNPLTISLAEAKKLYKDKLKQNANKYIKQFSGGLKIARGPYGPYITNGKKNAPVPKDLNPEQIKEDQAKELLAKAPVKRGRFRRRG